MTAPRISKPPAGAVALTAFRELPDGRGRQYSEAWTPGNPWQGCEHFIRTCGALGFLRDSTPEHGYAVVDAIGEDGDILATYDVPDARAFRFIYRKLRLRVVDTDVAQAARQRGNDGGPGVNSKYRRGLEELGTSLAS